jgi:hydrogenase maturation protease
MGLAPGEFVFFTPDDVATRKRIGGFSTHEGDLMNVLEFATAMGQPIAPVTIIGIEPAEIRIDSGLSAVLETRFEEYIAAAVGFWPDER